MDWILKSIGEFIGNKTYRKDADDMYTDLSHEALKLIDSAFSDITSPIIDFHTHLGGNGTNGSGCTLHSHAEDPIFHPFWRAKVFAFLSAFGVQDFDHNVDEQIVTYMVKLIRSIKKKYPWGKHFLLAMDKRYSIDGEPEDHKTGIYVPNEYVWKISQEYSDCFECCISIHPYRKDVVQEIDKWGERGVRLVKWLPNSMGINPSDPRCDTFYVRLKHWGMVLLCHTGKEHSIDPPGSDNYFGNPLFLRRPLEKGLKVIAAHCASEGSSIDLEHPERPYTSNFKLLLRLFEDPQYNDLLYGDISAMTAFLRIGDPLTTVLDRIDIQSRLVFGSDFPVPAVRLTVLTSSLVQYEYITEEERKSLNEIYNYNPLLFDYVVKRCLKSPDLGNKFSAKVFQMHPNLFVYK